MTHHRWWRHLAGRRACWHWLAWLALPVAVAAAPATGGACAAPGAGPVAMDAADLVLRDDAGQPLARWPLRDAQGSPGTLLAVCTLPQRQSFAIVAQGWQELWEISTDPAAPPIYDGLVHDWRLGEGIARPGHLGVRRIRLARPWVAVFGDARVPWLVGAEQADDGVSTAVVLHLDIRREVLRLPLGSPQAGVLQDTALQRSGAGAAWHLRLPAPGGGWQLLDTQRWQPVAGADRAPD